MSNQSRLVTIVAVLLLGCSAASQDAKSPPKAGDDPPKASDDPPKASDDKVKTEALEPEAKFAIDFEKIEIGKLPADFTNVPCLAGKPGAWEVRIDGQATSGQKVLVQGATDATDARFPMLVYDKLIAKNVTVSTRFKTLTGTVDQAAGLVARFKDARSYYITRANALENNICLYRAVGGVRQQFAKVDHPVSANAWHALKLEIAGKHFKVSFDGKVVIEADDATHADAGKAGVWTKADSVTAFDDLEILGYDQE